jgi:pre-mRNA-splicing factor SYF1
LAKETDKEKRAILYQNAIDTFEKALDTVDTSEPLVYSNLALLWNAYAHFYVNVEQPKEARQTWERAVNAEMSYDRTQVFMYYCAFEQSFDTQRCLEISRKAVANRQKGMTKSLKLWNLNLEWELKLGSWDSRKATFKQMCALKVVTPMTILKYALALKEGQHFEESFRVLEQGVLMFVWPNVQDIWLIYLSDFVERFKATNLECTRDLFEQVLSICPTADAAKFYLLFGHFEETYGMEAHALRIYWRAIDGVPDADKLTFYYLIFRRTAEFGTLLNTRPVCDRILEHANQMKEVPLIRKVINKFGKLYANMEESQGEVKRARVIYAYTAEYWVPEQGLTIFEEWRDFEQKFGNEFSFREMLRVKRSVEARAEFKV